MKRERKGFWGIGTLLAGLIIWAVIKTNIRSSKIIFESRRVNAINRTMFYWIDNNATPEFFQQYFSKRKIKSVAIYGTATLGELLFYYLSKTDIEIAYLMDKGAGGKNNINGVPIYRTDDSKLPPEVDAIVVTPVFYFDEIADELKARKIPAKKIISLERIVAAN